MVEELVGRVFFNNLSVVHEDHPVGHRAGKAHFVRHAQHGDALMRQLFHDVEDFIDHFRVERGGGLIKQHDLGCQAQGAGNGHALLLAARQLQGVLAGLFGDLHPLQLLHGALFGFFFGNTAHPHGRECEVFQNGEVREQVELLKHHAHAFAYGVDCLDVVTEFGAVHHQLAFLVLLKPVDTADQG